MNEKQQKLEGRWEQCSILERIGVGMAFLFLPSTVTCDLVPSLRKQLKYVSETIFWPCWNRSSKIQILWGNYYTADTATELSCRLKFLTVCVFHCCSEKMEALGVCCSQNWLIGGWNTIIFSLRGVFRSEVLLESMESFDEGSLMMVKSHDIHVANKKELLV